MLCVTLCCSFALYLSVFVLFLSIDLVLCNLIRRYNKAFIQAVLLMSIFEQRLSFRTSSYFMKNDNEIIVKCRSAHDEALVGI